MRSCTNRIAVVHNGILENYAELRERLITWGHRFTSETDTEVLAHLIEAGAALGRIDRAHHDAALSRPEARPDGGSRGGIERAGDALQGEHGRAGNAVVVAGGAGKQVAQRPALAAAVGM